MAPGNWESFRTSSPSSTVKAVPPGIYDIEVVAIDAFGNRSIATSSRKTIDGITSGVIGETAPNRASQRIETVVGAAATALSPTLALLTWTPPKAPFLKVAIRHTPVVSGEAWGAASPIVIEQPLASAGSAMVPALTGCYLLRFIDSAGNGSPWVALAPYRQTPTQPFLYAANYLESALDFAGAKINCAFDSATESLRVKRLYFDDMGLVDDWALLVDAYGAIALGQDIIDSLATAGNWDGVVILTIDEYGADGRSATYSFQNQLDLGYPFDVELIRTIRAASIAVPITLDAIIGFFDDMIDIDGELTDGGQIVIEYSTSQQQATSASDWTEWAPLTHCYALMRSLRLRARFLATDASQDIAAIELGASALLPQRIEGSMTRTSTAGSYAVLFAAAFYTAPSVVITPFDLRTGDFFEVTAITATGFSIVFKNSSGAAVGRSFQYQAVGFGSGVPSPPLEDNADRLYLWPPGVFLDSVFL